MPALDFGIKIAKFMFDATKRSSSPNKTKSPLSVARSDPRWDRPAYTRAPVHRQTLAKEIGELRPHEIAAGFHFLKGAGYVTPAPGSKSKYMLTGSGVKFVENPPAKPASKPYCEAFAAKSTKKTKQRSGPKAAVAPLHP